MTASVCSIPTTVEILSEAIIVSIQILQSMCDAHIPLLR
jgi:hypothetical protein